MAPPGVYTFNDQVDIMSISSNYWPSFVKSSSSPPSLSPTSPPFTSGLPPVHSDHDYILKPQVEKIGMSTETLGHKTLDKGVSGERHDPSNDAMLSSCVVDEDSMVEEAGDTDLLQELDDLDFTLADLDPCNDVNMDDCSFQEFIDSALDQSYPSFLGDDETSDSQQPSQSQDAVILNKEDFLRTLNLMPVQKKDDSTDSVMISSSSSISPLSPLGNKTSSDNTSSSKSCSAFSLPIPEDSSSLNVIPTKKCSCSVPDHMVRAVYSTAHGSQQEQVRTCSSTTELRKHSSTDTCTNCSLKRNVPEDLMTPLYIDTTSYGFSDTFQPLSDECLALLMDEDMPPTTTDAAALDFFKWLDDNQQKDNGSNTVASNDASVFTETSSHDSVMSDTLDLESFVDLEDLVTSTHSNDPTSQSSHQLGGSVLKDLSSSWTSHDHTYQKNVCQSKLEQKVPEECISCHSPLKLSFLTELCDHLRDASKHGRGSDSVMSPADKFHSAQRSNNISDSLSFGHSDDVLSMYSPGASSTSSSSPSPLPSMEMSLSDDCMETSTVKTHLALLDLFSDENASSLLHADSAISSIRYM